jgi:hypothetical protein
MRNIHNWYYFRKWFYLIIIQVCIFINPILHPGLNAETTIKYTFTPVGDSSVFKGNPDKNFGSSSTLKIDKSPESYSYILFDVQGLKNSVVSASLRMYVRNSTSNGPIVQLTETTWNEGDVTYNQRPASISNTITDFGRMPREKWIEMDLTDIITGNGPFSFGFYPESKNGVNFDSREGLRPPELSVITINEQQQIFYELSVNLQGEGMGTVLSNPAGIDCGTDCTNDYSAGSMVTLSATAQTGNVFMGWSGDCFDIQPTCSVTLDSSKSVIAQFEPIDDDNNDYPPFDISLFGLEGFGANTIGGRGGRVISVTNLNDSGSGSLRECALASGKRICIFRTGGTITLKSRIKIVNPYITIAGQTAPGGGITIKKDGGSFVPIQVRTNEVIVQFLTVRPGPGGGYDAISVYDNNANNVVFDHLSTSWATDETISVTGSSVSTAPYNVSVQWNLIAEPLNCSTHPDGCHGYGTLLNRITNISIHHNLYAHTAARAPQISPANNGIIDVVNNVIYNATGQGTSWGASHIKDSIGFALVNYVNNYVKNGEDSVHDYYVSASGGELFMLDNIVPGSSPLRPGDEKLLVNQHHLAPPVTTALTCSGTWIFRRDSIDQRIINSVMGGTGRIIDNESEVGGWTNIDEGNPCIDSDGDGMPDDFEDLYEMDKNDNSDANKDFDGDGYTNIEEYLSGTAGIL